MHKTLRSRLTKLRFNLHPAYWGTGARITYVAPDFREIRLKVPLTWRTRNLVGTTFGGSLFGALDPIYMVLLMHRLGAEYIVWDKSATVRFLKPGRETLYGRCRLRNAQVESIREELEHRSSAERVFTANLSDADGTVHTVVEKTIHIRKQTPRPEERVGTAAAGTFGDGGEAQKA